jgi:hypothetical protein
VSGIQKGRESHLKRARIPLVSNSGTSENDDFPVYESSIQILAPAPTMLMIPDQVARFGVEMGEGQQAEE